MAIAGACGLDVLYGAAVTTHMPMPLCHQVLKASAEIRIDDLDILDELDKQLEAISAATDLRNNIAHNSWAKEIGTDRIGYVKITARPSVDSNFVPVSIEKIEADALTIYQTGMNFMTFITLIGLLPKLPTAISPRGHKTARARKKRVKS